MNHVNCDVLTLEGTKLRAQKSFTIDALINGLVEVDYNPHVVCKASGAGRIVIDFSVIRAVCRVDFPTSISGMSQEIVRTRRSDNATSDEHTYQVSIRADSLLNICKRVNVK